MLALVVTLRKWMTFGLVLVVLDIFRPTFGASLEERRHGLGCTLDIPEVYFDKRMGGMVFHKFANVANMVAIPLPQLRVS